MSVRPPARLPGRRALKVALYRIDRSPVPLRALLDLEAEALELLRLLDVLAARATGAGAMRDTG